MINQALYSFLCSTIKVEKLSVFPLIVSISLILFPFDFCYAGYNLVSYGDFSETILQSPWKRWQSNGETAYIENSALAIETNTFWQAVHYPVFVERLGQYQFSFSAKTNEETRLRVLVQNFSTDEILTDFIVPKNTSWKKYTLFFNVSGLSDPVYLRFFPQDRFSSSGKIGRVS